VGGKDAGGQTPRRHYCGSGESSTQETPARTNCCLFNEQFIRELNLFRRKRFKCYVVCTVA
jgi:hypothetical protein